MFASFTATILKDRWVTLGALAVFVGLVVGGAVFLRADFSIQSFFGRDDPETSYLADYLERWGDSDVLIIVADGGEPGLLARDRLQRLDELVDKLDAVPGVSEVMSVTRVPRVNRGPAGTWIPVPLRASAPRGEPDDVRVIAWKQRLLSDPQVVPVYLSEDGRYGTILLTLEGDTADLAVVKPVVRAVEEVVHAAELDGISFFVGGVPAIRADVLDVIVRDQIVAVPVSAALMGLLLLALFRSMHGVLIPVLAAAVPNVMLLGIMGWTGESFGLLNQVYLALVPAIAVADAVHLLSRYHEEARNQVGSGQPISGEQRDAAIIHTMTFMGVACFLTSFTTIVGFASLLTTDMPVLRNFGIYAAVGVAAAYFTVIFIVPLALLWSKSGAKRMSHGSDGLLGHLLEGCIWLTTKHAWVAVGGAVVLTAGSIWAGTLVVTDWRQTESFRDDHPVSIANHLIDGHLGGVLSLEFDLIGPPGTFEKPEVLQAIASVEDAARSENGFRATVSPASLLRVTSTLVGGPAEIPAAEGTVRQLYNIADQAGIVSSFVSKERDRARVMVRMQDLGSVGFLAAGDRLSAKFAEALGPYDTTAHLTGSTFVSSRGMFGVTSDLRNSLISAFGIIGVVIALLFRSVRFGILSLVPNALPLMIGYGAMGLMGWELEPARAVVFTIAIGVSVDSAIHVLARFNEDRAAGMTIDEAIRGSILHSGRAITITSLMLMLGFGANLNSAAPANAAFGQLGAIIILGALVSNLVVLPALLKLGAAGGMRTPDAPAVD